MLASWMSRARRITDDPSRIVDYLRMPRKLVRGTPLMNRLGLQAARALKEQVIYNLRSQPVAPGLMPHLEVLDRDGFVVIPDFLPGAAVADLDDDLAKIEALPATQMNVRTFGENYESRLFAVSRRTEYTAFARHLRDNAFVNDLACALARRERTYKPHVILQWIYKPDPNAPHKDFEYNSYLHVDRHYPFLKAFYYLRDVGPDCAPYTYVRGSHKFNWDRLRFEYELGVRQAEARGKGRDTSPEQKDRDRVMEELASTLRDRLDLEEVPIVGRKNTLIVSNNQGLHRRWEMTGAGPRVTANLDFKFFESPAQRLFPLLRHIETPTAKALAW